MIYGKSSEIFYLPSSNNRHKDEVAVVEGHSVILRILQFDHSGAERYAP